MMPSAFAHSQVLKGTRYVCLDCGLFLGDVRTAASFRKLRKEPWAQDPRNRAAIEMAERRYPHDRRVTPWLLREFRRNRLMVTPQWQADSQALQQAEQAGDTEQANYYSQRLEGDRPDIVFFQPPEGQIDPHTPPLDENGNPVQPEPLQPGKIQNLIQMLDYYEQRQKPMDLMGKSISELAPLYDKWKTEYKPRDPDSGQVVYTYPNGWTMRRVEGQNDIFNEGEEMRNCVPKYVNQIDQGTHHLFSLRDHQNDPKANVLIVPQNQGGHWDGGTVVDIREGANRTPRPEYRDYIRNWFGSFNEPPTAHFNPGPPGDPGPGDPEDYGIDRTRYGKRSKVDEPMWTDVVEREPWIFTADKMNDYLMNAQARPDLQNPAAQEWLEHLRNYLHNEKTDNLMPFLTKEWKAGRMVPTPGYAGVRVLTPEDRERMAELKERYMSPEFGYGEQAAERFALNNVGALLERETLERFGDWLRTNHPSKRGLDLNNRDTTWADLHSRYQDYEKWLKKRQDREDTVWKNKDGSFIKKLRPEECYEEGDAMNNCIGGSGYDTQIRNGDTLLYSVRDKNGEPHITVQINPTMVYNPKTKDSTTLNNWKAYKMHGVSEAGHPGWHPQGDLDDYQPVPQRGNLIQVQGKNNAPPPEKYAPMLKGWFGSKHFQGSDGADLRPQWFLDRKHFNHMNQLYSPVLQHVVYYHPGDYGIESPGVSSDYKGLVGSLPYELTYDPEHKRLPFLVDWARRHGELDQLFDAIHDPEVHNTMKQSVNTYGMDPHQDPGYTQWLQENPEPQMPNLGPRPEASRCPYCSHAGHLRAIGEGPDAFVTCYWCGHNVDEANPEGLRHQLQRAQDWDNQRNNWREAEWLPWDQQRDAQANQALDNLREPAWQASPQKDMLDRLAEITEQAQGKQPVTARYACTCGAHNAASLWSFIKTANLYNRLRNQLQKSELWNPENELTWNVLKHAYPNHDKYAEWLHREVRKGRMTHNMAGFQDQIDRLQSRIERNEEVARQHRDAGDEYAAKAYEDTAEDYRRRLTQYQDQLTDPEKLSEAQLTHYNPTTGKTTTITPDLLTSLQAVLQKRKQKKQESNLMQLDTGDILDEAREHELAKQARNYGTVIHKFPDNWTIRHIDNGDEAKFESEMLGHCLHGYGDDIERGDSHNYSLRDPKGMPHVTLEIKHKREPTVDWDSVRDALGTSLYECPNCKQPIGRSGVCDHCGFNIHDLEGWVGGTPEQRRQIEDRAAGALGQSGRSNHTQCPNCGSKAKEHRYHAPGAENWWCRDCETEYPKEPGDPREGGEYDRWNNDGEFVGDNGGGIQVSPYKNAWENLRPDLQRMGMLHHDFRDGEAYQIEGKENVWPREKYHHYIRSWMGSIPYDERPLSTWRSYYTPGSVLHVNDLDQAPGFFNWKRRPGIDDFGFKAPNRKVDWDRIIHTLSPDVEKEWGTDRFSQHDAPPDARYDPHLGQRLFNYAVENDKLSDLTTALGQWGKSQNSYRNLGDMPCDHCGQRGYLHVQPNNYGTGPSNVYCSWCGENQEYGPYQERMTPAPEGRPTYTPYQAAVVQHLGPQLADIPDIANNEELLAGKPCRFCGRVGTTIPYPGAPEYEKCTACNNHWQKTANQVPIVPVEHTGYHGQPCNCLWHIAPKVHQARMQKAADKFNDFLMDPQARPDLQTPEAQQFLQTLQQRYLNDKTDVLMPWLVREWKKGRIYHQPPTGGIQNVHQAPEPYQPGIVQYTGPEDYEYEGPNGEPTRVHGLRPDDLNHWADWYNSNHHTRQGVDIMSLQSPDLVDRVRQWNNEMRENADGAAALKGRVEHTYPDGWTVQRLHSEAQLKDEGEKMGHCVGGYWPSVRDGRDLIYSLRDHQNEPHATWEITPQGLIDQCPQCKETVVPNRGEGWSRDPHHCGYVGETEPAPHGGTVVQIQGKGNEAPIPEYQERIKDYFQNNFDTHDLPTWEDQHIEDADDLVDEYGGGYTQYHDGDYGLEKPDFHVNWPEIVRDVSDWRSSVEPDQVVGKASELGELPDLENEVDYYYDNVQQDEKEKYEWEFDQDPETFAANHSSYEFPEPEPDWDDFESEDGEHDDDAYQEAIDKWEQERDDYYRDHKDEIIEQAWDDSDEAQRQRDWEQAISGNRYRRASVKRRKHRHYTMGHPCSCTFTNHLCPAEQAEDVSDAPAASESASTTASAVLYCETCGNPLEGSHCPQCDWGGYSNAMDPHQNPIDPTKEVKPAIQASALWDLSIPSHRWRF